MLPVLQNLKFFKPIISKTENVTAILNALINCSEENYDHRETVEEELYELRQYLSLESAAAVNKAIRSAASRLEQFASEEYIKEDDVKEQGKSYKADILLMVLDSLLAWLVESDSPVEPDTKKHTSKLYTALSKKILIKIQPILKTSLQLLHEYIDKDELVDESKVKEYIDECSHITIVNKYNRKALNRIFKETMLPHLKSTNSQTPKFFKIVMDVISRNRNSFNAYYIFECFLVVGLESVSEDQASLICDKLIEVCQIENAAFRLRKCAAIAVKFMLTVPHRINQISKLLHFLLVKEETRPRDATLLVDLREYIYEHGMFDELGREMIQLNSYSAFPRILVTAGLERVFAQVGSYDEKTRDELDRFVAELYDLFFFPYFKEGTNKSLKPYEEKHKDQLRKMQTLIVLSNYMKTSSL